MRAISPCVALMVALVACSGAGDTSSGSIAPTSSGGSSGAVGSGGSSAGTGGGGRGAGGSAGLGGAIGSGGHEICLVCSGGISGSAGATGSGGGGGSSGGSGGSGSPGTVTIEFTVVGPDSYCATASLCSAGPSIDVLDSTGNSFFSVVRSCTDVDCTTCQTLACPGYYCPPPSGVAVTGARLIWDGSYTTRSTCGAGFSCDETVYAPPGKYTAKMCAAPGTLTGQVCTNSGPGKCGTVTFEFPSGTVVKGTVGP